MARATGSGPDPWRAVRSLDPFSLVAGAGGTFTLVSLASFSVSYFVVRAEIERSIRATLVQEMVGFRAAPNPIALAALVDAQARSTDPGAKILSYTDILGRHSGNGAIVRTSEGFEAVALAGSGDEVARTYFALTERLHGGYLTLAASGDARAALRRTFTTILLISLLPTVAIALGGGLLLAQRSARRLAAVEATLGALTSGDITARMPALPGQADDLTRIGGRIDSMAEAHQASAEGFAAGVRRTLRMTSKRRSSASRFFWKWQGAEAAKRRRWSNERPMKCGRYRQRFNRFCKLPRWRAADRALASVLSIWGRWRATWPIFMRRCRRKAGTAWRWTSRMQQLSMVTARCWRRFWPILSKMRCGTRDRRRG